MKQASVLSLLILCIQFGCGTTSGSTGMSIESIRIELDRRACTIRMDDLAFELETILYYEECTINDIDSVLAKMPDSLRTCPGSGLNYVIIHPSDWEISCPSGHGSSRIIF
jgi:hypothetical protein